MASHSTTVLSISIWNARVVKHWVWTQVQGSNSTCCFTGASLLNLGQEGYWNSSEEPNLCFIHMAHDAYNMYMYKSITFCGSPQFWFMTNWPSLACIYSQHYRSCMRLPYSTASWRYKRNLPCFSLSFCSTVFSIPLKYRDTISHKSVPKGGQ